MGLQTTHPVILSFSVPGGSQTRLNGVLGFRIIQEAAVGLFPGAEVPDEGSRVGYSLSRSYYGWWKKSVGLGLRFLVASSLDPALCSW